MRHGHIALLLLAIAPFAATPVPQHSEPPADLVVLTEDLPPLAWVDKSSGALKGPSAELVERTLRSVGVHRQIEVMPWPTALATAETRPNTLLFNVARTAEREPRFQWIARTARKKIGVFRLRGPGGRPIATLDDVRGLRIGVLSRNVAQYALLKRGFPARTLLALPKDEQILSSLFSGRCDVWVRTFLSEDDLDQRIAATGRDPKRIEKVAEIDGESVDLYLVASHGTPQAFVERLRAALDHPR